MLGLTVEFFFFYHYYSFGGFDGWLDKLDEKSKLPQSLKVVLGEHDLYRQDETFLETKQFRVKNIFVHEEYVPENAAGESSR